MKNKILDTPIRRLLAGLPPYGLVYGPNVALLVAKSFKNTSFSNFIGGEKGAKEIAAANRANLMRVFKPLEAQK